MTWKENYQNKILTVETAAHLIKDNMTVVTGHACGEPQAVLREMCNHKERYHNVEIIHMLGIGEGKYTDEGMQGHLRHNSFFVGANTRKGVQENRADYTPCYFHELPLLIKSGDIKVDVALIQLSTPDEHGYCSFGISTDYTKVAADYAQIVIAEINPNMPRVFGDNFIHVSLLDYLVETDYPLIELNPPIIGEVEKKIGENCASVIEDGSTLQLGIGAIPDAVLMFLDNKKDLGVHSEMISDGILSLIEKGIVNNKKKSLHPGKIVATFLMGSRKLYDFVDNNPLIEMHSVDYVNHPMIVAQNYKMVSVNSCLQIDLMGQICADTIGSLQYSGVGGQVDFIRGCAMAKDGKSIIAIPSTASKGKLSRIVTQLDSGSAVTTTRNDADYVATEYGIVRLKGKNLKERGRLLISIAHPDFQSQLITYWEQRFQDKFVNIGDKNDR